MSREQLDGMMNMLEDVWSYFDELYGGMSEDDWTKPHGNDWIMSDLPYHLAYFDLEVVANPIKFGINFPNPEQEVAKTIQEVNDWNNQRFAERDPNLTVAGARRMAEDIRQQIRDLTAGLTDENLGDPALCKIFNVGWVNIGMAIGTCIQHNWNHVVELKLHLGKDSPIINPAINHFGYGAYMMFNPGIAYHHLKNNTRRFSTNITIEGAGGGTWNITAIETGGHVMEEKEDAAADLIITYPNNTHFIRNQNGISLLSDQVKNGEAKVNSTEALDTYYDLYRFPMMDQVIEFPPPPTA